MISHLRVSYVWRDELVADHVLAEPAPVTLGADGSTTFVVPPLALPAGFALFEPGADGYVLHLAAGMAGQVRLGGQELDVAQLVGAVGPAPGATRPMRLEPGDLGLVHLDQGGDHRVFFQFVRPDPPLPPAPWRDAGPVLAALSLALAMAAVTLAVLFHLRPERPGYVFPGKRELVAGYLIKRPEPPPPPAPAAPAAGEAAAVATEPPAATRGKEGKAGGAGDEERARAPDPDQGAPDEELPAHLEVGLLSKRSRAAISKTLDRGGFDERLGKALARMQGPATPGSMAGSGTGEGTGFGPGRGTGTSTRGGGGTGGGGKAIGDVRTSKPLDSGGTRAARGLPGGRGVKEVAVKVETGKPGGELGGLTAAEILKVVNSRRNGLRACYERELQRNKGLGGKVVLSWKITPSGAVASPRVQRSSLKNGRVEDCLVRQVASMKFPSPRNGSTAKVNFPFVFAPR